MCIKKRREWAKPQWEGKLTDELITKLTMYCGWALKMHQGDINKIHEAVLATYNHLMSTDDNRKKLAS